MEGYAGYAALNPADPSFEAYLNTPEAQQILAEYANRIFGGITENVTVSQEQVEKLAKELAAGYLAYDIRKRKLKSESSPFSCGERGKNQKRRERK